MNEGPITERERVVKRLGDDLYTAAQARRFIDSDEGQFLLNYINEVVSNLTNNILNKRLEQIDYVETRAKIDILRRLKAALEAKADTKSMDRLREELELAPSGN